MGSGKLIGVKMQCDLVKYDPVLGLSAVTGTGPSGTMI